MKRGRTTSQIAKISLTAAAALLLLSQAVMADEILTETPIVSGQIQSAGIFDDSYYSYSGNDFDVEIGDKALDDEKIIKFEALPVKEDSVLSTITKLIGLDRPLGIQFNLFNAYDSDLTTSAEIPTAGILDSITSIFNSPDKSNIEDQGVKVDNAIADLDIKYSPLNKGLKEEIIIPGDGEVFDTYQYQLTLDSGVKIHTAAANNIHKLGTGTIYFTDSTDNYFAHFLPLVAYDSIGAETNNIDIKYESIENNQYLLTVSVDKDWLLDTDRQYPVTIDPTIVHDTEAEFDNATVLNRTQVTSDPYVQIAPNGNDDNTKLLLHMEGNPASQAFVDSSPSEHSITANGNINQNTFPKFGNTSAYVDNSGDYLSIADSDDFYFDGDFTIDFWMYYNALPGTSDWDMIFTQWQGLNDRMGLYFDNRSSQGYPGMRFSWTNPTSTWYTAETDTGSADWEAGRWYHVALTRNGNEFTWYRDGNNIGRSTITAAYPNYAGQVTVGGEPNEAKYFNGYIDEFRVSKGVARWTNEFSPPARQYNEYHDYGIYNSEVLDLGTTAPTFNSLEWTEHAVRTGDGETDLTTNGLVAHWKFNETSGTTVSDSSGNGHNGTATNMVTSGQDANPNSGWTANNRKWGAGAIMFDGSNDYVNLAKSPTIKNQSKITITSWINVIDFDDYNCIYYESNNNSGYTRFNFTVETNGSIRIGGRDTDGTPSYEVFAVSQAGLVQPGHWYQVAAVYDADTDEHKVYLNGQDVTISTTASDAFPNTDPTDNITMGNAAGTNYGHFMLDSTSLYFRALEAEEIQSLYQASNVQLQTRTGADSTPDDGDWEEWKPAGAGTETQIDDYDNSYLYDPTDSDLVSYWPMDETSGANVDDPAGSNDGIATGTTIVDGKYSKARYFNGSSDDIDLGNNAVGDLVNGESAITISGWIIPDSISTTEWENNIFTGFTTSDVWSHNILVEGFDNNKLRVGGRSQAADSFQDVKSNQSINTSEWTHITAIYDYGNDLIEIYINGVLDKSQSVTFGASTYAKGSPTSNDFIGSANYSGRYFDGTIDEIKIFSKKLNSGEVFNDYLAGIERLGISPCLIQDTDSNINIEGDAAQKITTGAPKIDANTVGLWHLDETSGTGAYIKDSSGNGNNGTPTNTTRINGFSKKARGFNGSSDKIVIPDSASLDLTSEASVEAWVYYEGVGTNNGIVAIKQNTTGSTGASYGLIVNTSTNKVTFSVATSGNAWADYYSNSTIPKNTWTHLAGTYESGDVRIYINGELDASSSTPTGNLINSNGGLHIGHEDSWINEYFKGKIDEVQVSNIVRTPEEIYESYRAGRDHRIHNTLDSSVNLNTNNLAPFYVASDQPGTHAEVTFGESAFANYMPDADTYALWHLEEKSGSGAYLKDSSSYARHGTPGGTNSLMGKYGYGRNFNGTSDYINIGNQTPTTAVTYSAWVKWDDLPASGTNETIMAFADSGGYSGQAFYLRNNGGTYELTYNVDNSASNRRYWVSYWTPKVGQWHYLNVSQSGPASTPIIYIDGMAQPVTLRTTAGTPTRVTTGLAIGRYGNYNGLFFDGVLDEIRIDSVVRTADEIRQAYEIGRRTHPVTIDFAAALDSGNLISGSGDTSFTIDATAKGFINKGSNLYVGDKIIVRENYDGTEYIAQGTVNSVNISTGAVTVASWDTGGTFPTSGYTVNADVFKWQREYFDISDALDSHIDAVDNITWRILDGDRGRTFWIDDLNMVDDYLTDPTGSTITSTPNQYFQYRIIETTTDPDPTPKVSSVTLDYSFPLTMSGGSTNQTYIYSGNETAFNVQCNGVSITQTGKTVYCEGSWDQSDWNTIGSATSPLSNATIQGNVDITSPNWSNYPADGNVTLYVRAKVDSNSTSTYSFTIEKDTANPTIDSIVSVAGDSSSPYYDTTDDSSTVVVFNSTGASACKWDESDVTYTAMANSCDSTSQCTLNLSGLGAKSVSIGCIDIAGNYTGTADNFDLDYTIGGVSMTGAQSSDIAINNHNNTAYNIQCNGVTAPGTGTIRCYASFDQSDWHEVDNTTAPVSDVTLQNDMNVTGWTGYTPDGDKTIYTYVSDGTNNSNVYSFASHVDNVYPVINSITSVAGDTSAPYEDATNNASTFVVFNASADSNQCKWSTDVGDDYDTMPNSCGAAGNNCNLSLTGVQAHTAYIRCIDTHGNKQQSSLQVDYEIISEAPIQQGWKYYRDITLNPATTVSNEQIKINLTPGNFDYANAQDDGGDLRFFDELGENEFDYWIEIWNTAGTSKVWVEVPTIGTDKLLMQYGNDSTINKSNYDATFTKDFSVNTGLVGLWHIDEKTNNTCSGGEDLCESSGNNLHATINSQSAITWRLIDGGYWDSRTDTIFASGGHIDGTQTSHTFAYVPETGELDLTQAITLEVWANIDASGSGVSHSANRIVSKAGADCNTAPAEMYGLAIDSSLQPYFNIGDVGNLISSSSISHETWHHIVGTYDNATDTMNLYIDGKLANTSTFAGDYPIPTNDTPFTIGGMYYDYPAFQGCDQSWLGGIDEVRIYDRALPYNEVLAHYERRNVPTGPQPVATVGGVRTDTVDEAGQSDWYNIGWAHRTELTVINEGNSNTLTNYQVQLNIDTKIYIDQSQMQADGDDIRFTDSDGTTLMPYYIISGINTNNTRIYVKVPTVPANNNKTIYMYYGNPNASAYENYDNTFTKNSDFDELLGLWHFDEGVNDSCSGGEDICDSSGNEAHGNFVDAPAWQSTDGGQWDSRSDLTFATGDHLYFDGSNDYITMGNDTSLMNSNNQLTLSAWVNPTSDASEMSIISQSPTGCSTPYNWHFRILADKTVAFTTYTGFTVHTQTSEFTVSDSAWTHLAVVFDGVQVKFYKNGELLESYTDVHKRDLGTSRHTFIGLQSDGCTNYFKGYMDEVAIHAQALNDSQILGLYERRKATAPEPQAGYYLPGYIEKGGEIQSETWELGSTIYITNPVTIAAGETLTIEPGTVVKFASDAYIEADGAAIIAEGTANNPIYFTSRDDDGIGLTVAGSDGIPAAGDYHGIYVYGSGSSGSFKFCDFNYGGEELLLDSTTFKGMLNTKQVDITAYNNVFNNSANADIFVYNAGPDIQRNNLGDSPYGLYIDAGGNIVDATIEYNSFANTALAGLYIDNLPDTDNDGGPGLVLRHNDFDNTNTGFYIDNPSGSAVRDSDAENTVDATMNAFENVSGYMCYYDVAAGSCKFDRTAGGEILFDTNSAIITTPNGGESFFAGSSQNITWSFNNGSTDGDYLDIMLSTNSGAEFDQTIVAGLKCDGSGLGSGCTGTSGTYNWTVPSIGSTETRVKVSMRDSSGNTLVEDISDSNFSITVMQDTLSDYTPDADSTHTIQFVVRQNSGTFVDDSVKITFPDEFDLSISAADVSASGGDVTWSSAEIIDTNSVTFPFTGTLDYNDSVITIVIGNTTSAVNNPENEGSYRISLTIHDGQSGSGNAIERLSTNILITEGLAFTINVESALEFSIRDTGDTQDITTLDFGDLSPNTIYDLSHILKITSNAFNGYTITAHEEHDLSSTSDYIPDINGTNDIPISWSSPPGSGTNGYYGYHTSDSSLGTGTTTRFASADSWAALTSDPQEVAFSDTLAQDEITTMTYRLEINSNQTAGSYSHTVLYIATPKY